MRGRIGWLASSSRGTEDHRFIVASSAIDGVCDPSRAVPVFLWVAPLGQLGGWSQTAGTDEAGRYVVAVVNARVFLNAWDPPYQQQPCLASTVVNGPTTLDVQVVRTGTFASPSDGGRMLTGFVYEMTP